MLMTGRMLAYARLSPAGTRPFCGDLLPRAGLGDVRLDEPAVRADVMNQFHAGKRADRNRCADLPPANVDGSDVIGTALRARHAVTASSTYGVMSKLRT